MFRGWPVSLIFQTQTGKMANYQATTGTVIITSGLPNVVIDLLEIDHVTV